MPGGDHPHLRWIHSRAEDFTSDDTYGLVTAGDSLHWMDWEIVLPLLSRLLPSAGFLAIVNRPHVETSWQVDLTALIARYSTYQFYETFDLIAELERRDLFKVVGRYQAAPEPARQRIDDYIESFHSRSSLSRDNLPAGAAEAFDARLRELVTPWAADGWLSLTTAGEIVWGHPGDPTTASET